ncbi:GNAT family N-acetyltransferase [Amphritea pacifica]|uniref:GNAT family N-acetyltransferase n=1 Tax=Amphritea pacifica TaxID=2811233 RepID=A0ABS2W9A6_9GAMM|nr:GNAT family N-acetyltransferase [Amphritea pacifica]MBN0988308.1 GNAT family N-acetyltransferase [Amphritea pacifica]MBN1005581.1 GNAT family N-acetyltransferase [Amphritea pacifica]
MDSIETRNPQFTLRVGTADDATQVVSYMKKLGEYQKMLDKITATEADIRRLLSEKRGEVIFGEYAGETVGFIYFYQNSSAFTGQTGLYIDGFFIDQPFQSQGLGKIMLAYLSKLALKRGCKRLEWGCLDWNAPAIHFYRQMGANSIDEMTIYRFGPQQLEHSAAQF